MLLNNCNPVFITLFCGISLFHHFQASVSVHSNATIINNGSALPPTSNELSLSANTDKSPVEEDYFKDFMENLNYLKENVKLEPQEGATSRMFEMPTQLKVSDIQTSKYYARLAGAAYCTDANLKSWSCSHCKKTPVQYINTYFDKPTKTKAYLAIDKNKKAVVLSFRGSSRLKNFIQDVKILKDPIVFNKYEYWVHRGFKQCSENLLPLYVNKLKELLNEHREYKLVVVGHSLGGAIATLSALILRENLGLKDDSLSVFTYGEPRIGDKEFARYLNQQAFSLTRVVNNNDLVAHLPPQAKLVSDYYHHHNEIWVNGKKEVYCNDSYLEDPNCSASKWYAPSVFDHLKVWDIKLGGIC